MDLVDAFGQMGGYVLVESMGMRDFGAFPVSIGELVLFPREIAPGSKFICRASCRKNENELRLQVELLTEDGQTYIQVRDFTMQIFPFSTRYMATLYWQRPHLEFSTVFAPAPAEVVLRTIDVREHPYLERGNDIWVRGLAFMVLGVRERKLWLAMAASRSRKLNGCWVVWRRRMRCGSGRGGPISCRFIRRRWRFCPMTQTSRWCTAQCWKHSGPSQMFPSLTATASRLPPRLMPIAPWAWTSNASAGERRARDWRRRLILKNDIYSARIFRCWRVGFARRRRRRRRALAYGASRVIGDWWDDRTIVGWSRVTAAPLPST